jgi:uncharacterized protein YggE
MENTIWTSEKVKKAVLVTLGFLTLFLFAKTVGEFSHMDDEGLNAPQSLVSVTGTGEVFAVPDVAAFSFVITEEGKDTTEAQKKHTAKNNAVMKYLKDSDVLEKDIKTESYTMNPKYENTQIVCIKYPCTQPNPKIVGYEVTESISVKVKDIDNAGKIVTGLGAIGISNVYGPTLTIENDDVLKAKARALAIADAKAKMDVLAKDLGVKVKGITSFSENEGPVSPMYAMSSKMGMGGASDMAVPEIAKGENKISVMVYITYRIK